MNGASGIPREGREAEYATEMWLADPSAFWLHPEGPLSDTTPEEWRHKEYVWQRDREVAARMAHYDAIALQAQMNPYMNAPYQHWHGLQNSPNYGLASIGSTSLLGRLI